VDAVNRVTLHLSWKEHLCGDLGERQAGAEQRQEAEFGPGQCRRSGDARAALHGEQRPKRLDLAGQVPQATPAPEQLIDLAHERPIRAREAIFAGQNLKHAKSAFWR
jgi:hypothetical protein